MSITWSDENRMSLQFLLSMAFLQWVESYEWVRTGPEEPARGYLSYWNWPVSLAITCTHAALLGRAADQGFEEGIQAQAEECEQGGCP